MTINLLIDIHEILKHIDACVYVCVWVGVCVCFRANSLLYYNVKYLSYILAIEYIVTA